MDGVKKSWRNDLLAIALLAIASTLIFADVLFVGNHFYIRDLTRYYYPTKQIIREVYLNGEFPYWNPYYSAGQPMAANPEYEVFYPPQLLVLLPDYDLGYRLHILIHLPLAAIGMYLFLRSMRLRIFSAMLGSVAFTFGGLFMSLINLLPILFCATWIPWALMFARRTFLRPNLRDAALTVLMFGIQNLTAEPTTLIQTWFLTGCMAFYLGFLHKGQRMKVVGRNLALAIALGAAGLLAGAAQMFPAIDHVGDSVRSRPFDFALVTAWSMPPVRPLELIYRNLFGHISVGQTMYYWGGNLYKGMGVPFLFNIHVGLIIIAMVVAGLFVKQRGRLLLAIVIPVSTLLALGGYTMLFEFLYEIGIAKSVRYPEKYSLMGIFLLIVYASIVFDRILRRDRETARAALGFTMASTLFAMLVLAFSLTPWFPENFNSIWRVSAHDAPKVMQLVRADWLSAMVRGLVLCVLLWLASNRRIRAPWAAACVILLFIDLAPLSRQVLPRMPRSFFTPPPVTARLDPDRPSYRIFHEMDWYGSGDVAKKYFSTRDAVYWIVRNGLFPMTPASWGYRTILERDYDKTALLPTVDLTDAMWRVRDNKQKKWPEIFMAMSGARYRSTYVPFADEWKRTKGNMKRSEPIRFIESKGNERYYFSRQLVKFTDQQNFIQRLTKESFARSVAFVPFKPFAASPGRVLHAKETFNTITLDAESRGVGYLVLSVTPHKYWKATIDGKETTLHVTNIGYQGLVVPPGRHTIHLRYRNTVVFYSLITSVIVFVTLLLTIFFSRHAALPSPRQRNA